jgi:hypothetical protein
MLPFQERKENITATRYLAEDKQLSARGPDHGGLRRFAAYLERAMGIEPT